MGEQSKIEWTDHTFNPWMGCTKVSAGCAHCYAEELMDHRYGKARWGNNPRVRTKGPWRDVLRWNREAQDAGVRRRVFCASLADVFEDAPGLGAIRADLWPLIEQCTALDWQLLTKRPENVGRMVPFSWMREWWPDHVWLGVSVEDQKAADERIPLLLRTPAAVRFLSCEPLLSGIDLSKWVGSHNGNRHDGSALFVGDEGGADFAWSPRGMLNWVIAGGESGPGARPCDVAWIRSIVEQCRDARVACFVKQLGGRVFAPWLLQWVEDHAEGAPGFSLVDSRDNRPKRRRYANVWKNGTWHTWDEQGIGGENASGPSVERAQSEAMAALVRQHVHPHRDWAQHRHMLVDKKGGDPSEWPEDLCVREFPRGAS